MFGDVSPTQVGSVARSVQVGLVQQPGRLVFVPSYQEALGIIKFVRTKEIFGHSNIVLKSLPSHIFAFSYISRPFSFAHTFLRYFLVHFSACLYVYYHIYLIAMSSSIAISIATSSSIAISIAMCSSISISIAISL